jgi:hypothetical protein
MPNTAILKKLRVYQVSRNTEVTEITNEVLIQTEQDLGRQNTNQGKEKNLSP